jgi:hypothetical protein
MAHLINRFVLMIAFIAIAACTPTPAPTPIPPTATPNPPTATPQPTATDTPAPSATLALEPPATFTPEPQAEFTRAFAVSYEGELFGNADDVHDGNSETWASMRGRGGGIWIFDLGNEQLVSGVKFLPIQDSGDAVYVRFIEVSGDGQTWTPGFTGSGVCDAPNCDPFPPGEWTVKNFDLLPGRYVRIVAGARWLALAEVEIEVRPITP